MIEVWNQAVGYEGVQISNLGRIRRRSYTLIRPNNGLVTVPDRVLIGRITRKGYLRARFSFNGVEHEDYVHRMVAAAFVKNPLNKPHVNHINGVKTDNRPENLEWVTAAENNAHARNVLGVQNPLVSVCWLRGTERRKAITGVAADSVVYFDSIRAAEAAGFHRGSIRRCLKNPHYKHMGFSWFTGAHQTVE